MYIFNFMSFVLLIIVSLYPGPRTLDLDGNGSLDFKEYIMVMDLVEAKTPEEKLKWAFRM